MTGFELLLLVLLVAAVLLSVIGGWFKHLGLIGFALAALSLYLLCQLVHAL